jgi:hypothetical protein
MKGWKKMNIKAGQSPALIFIFFRTVSTMQHATPVKNLNLYPSRKSNQPEEDDL